MSAREDIAAHFTSDVLADELLDAYRAEVLRQEGDAIVKHCPDHGPQDQDGVWMDCHCDVADEMRRRANKAATGGAA